MFIKSSGTILALFVGPLLLIYAWATFVFAPYRHVLGILASILQINAGVMFYLIEIFYKYQQSISNSIKIKSNVLRDSTNHF